MQFFIAFAVVVSIGSIAIASAVKMSRSWPHHRTLLKHNHEAIDLSLAGVVSMPPRDPDRNGYFVQREKY